MPNNRPGYRPIAVLNALSRIVASCEERIDANTRELELARTQLRDYEARLGRSFAHAAYLDQLTSLRDRLKCPFPHCGRSFGENVAELRSERVMAFPP